MLKRTKINLKDGVVVSIPYKNGTINWRMYADRTSYYWRFSGEIGCPLPYQPKRVEQAHNQFLHGQKLQNKLIRSAAAQHKWKVMESLKLTFKNVKRLKLEKNEQIVK